MKPQFTKSTGFKLGFKLNMQIIADALEETFSQMELYDTENICRLEGVKIFSAKTSLKKNYVYLISSCSVDEKFSDYKEIPFIIVGRADAGLFPENSPILQIIDGTDFLEIFDLIQET